MYIKVGSGVEWTGTDGAVRFGVVILLRPGDTVADCTVDTFYGDPLHTVPVETHRLRERVAPQSRVTQELLWAAHRAVDPLVAHTGRGAPATHWAMALAAAIVTGTTMPAPPLHMFADEEARIRVEVRRLVAEANARA